MNSRITSFISLSLLFVALLGVYWYGFKDRTPPSENQSAVATPIELIALETTNIQEVTWTFTSTKGTLQQNQDSTWKLVDPAISVDNSKASLFVSSISRLSGQRKYPFSEVSKENAGLITPEITLAFKMKDGASHKVLIGKKTIDGEYYYAAKEGQDFSVLLSAYVVEDMRKDPYSLVPSPSGSPVATP